MISTPVFMRTMIDHPAFAAHRLVVGAAVLARRRGRRAGDGARGRGRVRRVGASARTARPSTRRSRPAGSATTPSCDATTDGRLIDRAELRIVDPETLADVAPGTPGELLARGPEMFVGYLDAALDAESFVAGGWFRTGDLARFDGEHLTIVDRLKDIIIRGGENISAQEVEALLVTHPDVAEAACVAAPDPVMGEEVCAFVIAAGDDRADARGAARAPRRAGLARFKLPSRLEVRADLPRTASGKVQKAPLRAELAGVRTR